MAKKVLYPEVAARLEEACDTNPNIPAKNYGRLGWFVNELGKRGVPVTNEGVRKWFAGQALPRPKALKELAKILRTDEAWLLVGPVLPISHKEAKLRSGQADGGVNLVAGLIQMHGGQPAFPSETDEFAQRHKIDLYAIIKGAQYPIHVALFSDGLTFVPAEALTGFVIGVISIGPTNFRLVELDSEVVQEIARKKSGLYEVREDAYPWRVIESFEKRL